MSLDDPAIITGAISGAIANREQCPAIPYTPEEYAAEARRIVDGIRPHVRAATPLEAALRMALRYSHLGTAEEAQPTGSAADT